MECGTSEIRTSKLIAHGNQTGHCIFPTKSKKNPALGRWLTSQRADKKSGKIDQDNERRLDEIGFVWDRYLEKDKGISGQQETE